MLAETEVASTRSALLSCPRSTDNNDDASWHPVEDIVCTEMIMDDDLLARLVPFLAAAVAPTERFGTEDEYYAELERLGAELDAVCESTETREVISHITEIIRDLAWAVDELTGTDKESRRLIVDGNSRTWFIDDDGDDSSDGS